MARPWRTSRSLREVPATPGRRWRGIAAGRTRRRTRTHLRVADRPQSTRTARRVYKLGIGAGTRSDHVRRHGVVAALPAAVDEAWSVTDQIDAVPEGHAARRAVDQAHLSGPITIAQVANLSANEGLPWFLGFLGAVSLGLAILNLLPIPILDGGHILYYLIELIKGSPVSDRTLVAGQYVGLVMLSGLIGTRLLQRYFRPVPLNVLPRHGAHQCMCAGLRPNPSGHASPGQRRLHDGAGGGH
jgi:regulator of sigma E protease